MPSRWNLAYRLDVLEVRTRRLLDVTASAVEHLNRRFDRLEKILMASFAEVSADLDVVTNGIADGYEKRDALIAELRSAVAAGDLVRAQALADQDAQHAAVLSAAVDRLRGLGHDAENPVPDTTPLPEAPAVEVPGDSAPVEEAPAEPVDVPTEEAPAEPVDVPTEDAPVADEGSEQV